MSSFTKVLQAYWLHYQFEHCDQSILGVEKHIRIVDKFKAEFDEMLINHLGENDLLVPYISKVYYDGICSLLLQFKELQWYVFKRKFKDGKSRPIGVIVSRIISDEIRIGFIRVLHDLATQIHRDAERFQILSLRPPVTLKREDYNSNFEYIRAKEAYQPTPVSFTPKRAGRKKKGKETRTLRDIWEPDKKGSKSSYDEAIALLKQDDKELLAPFVTEINGELHWSRYPVKGFAQYLAGFIYTCMHNNWIQNNYTAPEWKKILFNTFHVEFDCKPFKQLYVNKPEPQYLKPFRGLPSRY